MTFTVRSSFTAALAVSLLALCSLGLSAHAAGEATLATHPVVGTWSWPLFGGKCVETFQYRPSGTLLGTSGEAVTEWTYTISAEASEKGFYKATETSVRQNGKPDCSGDVVDQDGDIHTRFIQFSPARDRMIICKTESLAACFGPLSKVQ